MQSKISELWNLYTAAGCERDSGAMMYCWKCARTDMEKHTEKRVLEQAEKFSHALNLRFPAVLPMARVAYFIVDNFPQYKLVMPVKGDWYCPSKHNVLDPMGLMPMETQRMYKQVDTVHWPMVCDKDNNVVIKAVVIMS